MSNIISRNIETVALEDLVKNSTGFTLAGSFRAFFASHKFFETVKGGGNRTLYYGQVDVSHFPAGFAGLLVFKLGNQVVRVVSNVDTDNPNPILFDRVEMVAELTGTSDIGVISNIDYSPHYDYYYMSVTDDIPGGSTDPLWRFFITEANDNVGAMVGAVSPPPGIANLRHPRKWLRLSPFSDGHGRRAGCFIVKVDGVWTWLYTQAGQGLDMNAAFGLNATFDGVAIGNTCTRTFDAPVYNPADGFASNGAIRYQNGLYTLPMNLNVGYIVGRSYKVPVNKATGSVRVRLWNTMANAASGLELPAAAIFDETLPIVDGEITLVPSAAVLTYTNTYDIVPTSWHFEWVDTSITSTLIENVGIEALTLKTEWDGELYPIASGGNETVDLITGGSYRVFNTDLAPTAENVRIRFYKDGAPVFPQLLTTVGELVNFDGRPAFDNIKINIF